MISTAMNIVMYNMSPASDWEKGVVNCNRQILSELSKRDEVTHILAIDFLPFSLERKFRMFFLDRMYVRKDGYLMGNASGQLYFPAHIFGRRNEKIVFSTGFSDRLAVEYAKKWDEPPVVWSYNPLYIDYFDAFPDAKFVFHAVDDWSLHPNYKKYKKELSKNYDVIAKRSDVIFTVSKRLLEKFHGHSRAFFSPNGVDVKAFASACKNNAHEELEKLFHINPFDIAGKKRTVVGYVGNVQERFDIALVKQAVLRYPEFAFIIAGEIWKTVADEVNRELGGYENVFFPGRVPYVSAVALINAFDVAIIPHKNSAFCESMDPMKLYDYLACGKPVVATRSDSLTRFANLVYLSDGHDEFLANIRVAFETDSEDKRLMRREQMREHTWEKRMEPIMRHIESIVT